jgi:Mg-chelatase subunit ChlD
MNSVLLCTSLLLIGQASAAAQGLATPRPGAQTAAAEDERVELSRRESGIRLGQFRAAQHWSVKSVVLSGLGVLWHPDATPAVAEALASKDDRLRVQGLEALRRMGDDALRAVATAELLEVLTKESVQEKNDLFAARVQEVLTRIFPDAGADSRSEWQAHWRKLQPTYDLPTWRGPGDPQGDGRSSAASAVDRALDLSTAGLEICFVIDATGSMQTLLDAVVHSAQETSAILAGFASELRLATVIYRDLEDMPGGSDVVEPLTKKLDQAYKALAKVVAGGGGDIPEAIEAGIEHALSLADLGWSKEANKLLIVMGDAPAHDARLPRAVELARAASTDMGVFPDATDQRRKLERAGRKVAPRSGKNDVEGRPFVVSCIGVMHPSTGGGPQQDRNLLASHLRQIADAGKGMYGELEVDTLAQDAAGTRQLVQMVVEMSFGERYEGEVKRFLDTYFEYREAGLY